MGNQQLDTPSKTRPERRPSNVWSGLSLEGLRKAYAQTDALDGVSFCVPAQSIVAVLGPSGAGKSTLLSVIAGLEAPDAGRILWEGEPVDDVPAHRRGLA